MFTDSSAGRNGIEGIWYEREYPFDASRLKAGANTIKLTVPGGGGTAGIIYDYLGLELDENAAGPAPTAERGSAGPTRFPGGGG